MRKFLIGLSAFAVAMPVIMPPDAADAQRRYRYREWRGQDGRTYCRKSNGTTGLVVGGVAGALAGRAIDTGGDRTVGTLGGAALGALAGRAIERGNSPRRCR
jgi:uncharacterized protein YcfJ